MPTTKKDLESEELFNAIIDTAIEIACADYANIQLVDYATGHIKIVAQRGFSTSWVEYWDSLSSGEGSCRTAFNSRSRVIVEDIQESPLFSEEERVLQLQAGVRAVQSTPLFSKNGELIGVFSTHYKKPWRPTGTVLRTLDSLAKLAVCAIELVDDQ